MRRQSHLKAYMVGFQSLVFSNPFMGDRLTWPMCIQIMYQRLSNFKGVHNSWWCPKSRCSPSFSTFMHIELLKMRKKWEKYGPLKLKVLS
jgi:hypothetical protein